MKTSVILRALGAAIASMAVATIVTALYYSGTMASSVYVSGAGIFVVPALIAALVWSKLWSRVAAYLVLVCLTYSTALIVAARVFHDGL